MHSESENLLGAVTAYLHHGLLLIEDPDTTAAHEGWEAATQPVHFDTDSLYLAVRPAVDGPVTVHAFRQHVPDIARTMTLCFDDQFESRFGFIKLHDPDESMFLTIRDQPGTFRIRVFVDDLGMATQVLVIIG